MLALIISTLACLVPSHIATTTITLEGGRTEHGSIVMQCVPNLPQPQAMLTPILPPDQPPFNDFKKQLKNKAERDRRDKIKAEDKG